LTSDISPCLICHTCRVNSVADQPRRSIRSWWQAEDSGWPRNRLAEIPRVVRSTHLLSEQAEHLLHAVWGHFKRAPDGRAVRSYNWRRADGPLDQRRRAIGHEPFDCGTNTRDATCRVRLRALVDLRDRLRMPLQNADVDAANVVRAIKYTVSRLLAQPETPPVSSKEFTPALSLTDVEADRVARLLEDTVDVHQSGSFSPANLASTSSISPEIIAFEHIKSARRVLRDRRVSLRPQDRGHAAGIW
jgi:hypothetical protein